jgi:hypothetical protein
VTAIHDRAAADLHDLQPLGFHLGHRNLWDQAGPPLRSIEVVFVLRRSSPSSRTARPIDEVLRGLVRDSTSIPASVKLLEIDARVTPCGQGLTNESARSVKRHLASNSLAFVATVST